MSGVELNSYLVSDQIADGIVPVYSDRRYFGENLGYNANRLNQNCLALGH